MTTKFFKLPDLQERYGVTRQTITAWEKEGQFPKAVRLGPKLKVWPISAIEQFEAELTQKDTHA